MPAETYSILSCPALFFLSFAAATLLPLSSEATFLYMLSEGLSPGWLLLSAGSGNTLGSVFNYYLGRKGTEWLAEHDKIPAERLERYEIFFGRWGG
jgi:membrane protein YqaA with SNARE-associated domain